MRLFVPPLIVLFFIPKMIPPLAKLSDPNRIKESSVEEILLFCPPATNPLGLPSIVLPIPHRISPRSEPVSIVLRAPPTITVPEEKVLLFIPPPMKLDASLVLLDPTVTAPEASSVGILVSEEA
jgi:hypothetical protein